MAVAVKTPTDAFRGRVGLLSPVPTVDWFLPDKLDSC